jgi:NAD dependent epimerase/dehydratase family enzyme
MRLFCFGYGYSAEALARKLSPRLTEAAGTRTNPEAAAEAGARLAAYKGDGPSAEVKGLLAGTTHLLVSIPPDLEGDAVLRDFADDIAALPDLTWIGYLSTVGVYGDAKGAWVDETNPVRPLTERSLRRAEAERAWLDFGTGTGRRVEVFRLAGIYGPGRSVIDSLRAGTARRIVKPGQVFNRIHVDDIARALAAAIDTDAAHRVFNVSDDEPAPPQDVVACAAELIGLPIPETVAFEAAGLTGVAASFWSECKRVKNERIRRDLGVDLLYPTYREGLRALALL